MNKEDIDKNLELVLYILLGILDGFYGLVAAEFTAYAIGYKRLKRLFSGFLIGALIYSILSVFLIS